MSASPRSFTFTGEEVVVLRGAMRLLETTMNQDELVELSEDLGLCLGGKVPGKTRVRKLCAALGVYDLKYDDGSYIQPFFEDDA